MTKNTIYTSFLLLSILLLPVHANARQAVAIDYLYGFDDISGLRLAYRPVTTEIYTDWFGDIKLYWEASINVWEYGENDTHSTNVAIALSPVVVKKITDLNNKYPLYIEAGIGASLVNDREFAGKNIGSHYQFEDRLGLLLSLDGADQQQIALRYMHYSNGGLNSKNPGLDFLNLSYSYHF
ncbi:acyloxyacyl hydrolase [Aestuariibacter sp. A3R04]|uniref:acyloxyacyl hydrolase n=1 Tax=Aestuariibacter sp. A3R04 TaxID=2841571 RepID=UPI001C09B88E|nr:acyloxyacyl hydrolase [Aestuariibacter sp. A3R04]MBU3023873.1 acyloxyacyl hydrolase [Aestuariibacter sp. A3R04]